MGGAKAEKTEKKQKNRIVLAVKTAFSVIDVGKDYVQVWRWVTTGDTAWGFVLLFIVLFSNVWTAWRMRPKSWASCRSDLPGIVFLISGFGILYYAIVEWLSGDIDNDDSKFERARYLEVMYESLPSAFLNTYVLIQRPKDNIGVLFSFWSIFSVAKGAIQHVRNKNDFRERAKNSEVDNDEDRDRDQTNLYFGHPLGLMLGIFTSFFDAALRILTFSLLCSVPIQYRPINFILALLISVGVSLIFNTITERLSKRCGKFNYGFSKEAVTRCYLMSFLLRVLTSTAAGFFRWKASSKWFWIELVVRHLIVDWLLFVLWLIVFQDTAHENWALGVYGLQAMFWIFLAMLVGYLKYWAGGNETEQKLQSGSPRSPKSPKSPQWGK